MSAAQAIIDTLGTRGVQWELLGIHGIARGMVGWIAVRPAASRVVSVARAEHRVRIEETGLVSVLRVVNDGSAPVLLPADLILGGGLQTRCVDRTIVVAGSAQCLVPVRCVERDRWSPRDGRTANRFDVQGTSSLSLRRTLGAARGQAFRRGGDLGTDQSFVWSQVDADCTRTRSGTATSSYEGYLRSVRARHLEAARRSGVVPPAGANGAVLLTGDGQWMEVYPSADALADAVTETVADLFDEATPPLLGPRAIPAALAAVERAAEVVWSAKISALAGLPGAVGDYQVMMSEAMTGTAVLLDGALAHLVAAVR